jgi:fatty acid desaturase
MNEPNDVPENESFDPVYLHTRRETLFIITAWICLCVWVVGVSLLTGYNVDPDTMKLVAGMPAWVFWGVALPWLASNIFIVWFCLKFMADDPLGEDEEPQPESATPNREAGHE